MYEKWVLRTLTWCSKDPVPIPASAGGANDKIMQGAAPVAQHESVIGSWQLSRSGPSIGPSVTGHCRPVALGHR